jgi:hypothetical protein
MVLKNKFSVVSGTMVPDTTQLFLTVCVSRFAFGDDAVDVQVRFADNGVVG